MFRSRSIDGLAVRGLHTSVSRHLEAMGVTRIAGITGLDVLGFPVVQAIRPNSRALSVAQGKGRTRLQAEVSAMLEAAETWHAERIRLPLVYRSHSKMTRHSTCPQIAQLPTYSGCSVDPDVSFFWVEGADIARNAGAAGCWIPYDLVHTNFTPDHNDAASPFYRSTSGLAAGNERDQVLLHAICEVVERDTAARAIQNPTSVVAIDLESIADADCRSIIECVESANIACSVNILPSQSGLPVAHATLTGSGGRFNNAGLAFGGYGCALCPSEAVFRALAEAAQSRLTAIAGARDDLAYANFETTSLDSKEVARSSAGKALSVMPKKKKRKSKDALNEVLEMLERSGVRQVIAIDLGQKEQDLCVYRVVIPGMDTSVHPGDCNPMAGFSV